MLFLLCCNYEYLRTVCALQYINVCTRIFSLQEEYRAITVEHETLKEEYRANTADHKALLAEHITLKEEYRAITAEHKTLRDSSDQGSSPENQEEV